ncbi:MAG: DUF4112 domain-containing protein [Phycisphaerales bacterium]
MTGRSPEQPEPAPWVFRLARLMDSEFQLPGTSVRFGLDPIIGLLPVVGDTVTLVIGTLIIREAIRQRLPRRVIMKMLVNLGIDWLVGLLPGIDIVFDAAFKAHERNAGLLLEHARGGSEI